MPNQITVASLVAAAAHGGGDRDRSLRARVGAAHRRHHARHRRRAARAGEEDDHRERRLPRLDRRSDLRRPDVRRLRRLLRGLADDDRVAGRAHHVVHGQLRALARGGARHRGRRGAHAAGGSHRHPRDGARGVALLRAPRGGLRARTPSTGSRPARSACWRCSTPSPRSRASAGRWSGSRTARTSTWCGRATRRARVDVLAPGRQRRRAPLPLNQQAR